jgi:hypothetical protein
VPTLVVQGSRDQFGIPPAAARRTVVEVQGDHSLRTDLAAVAAALRDWLERILWASASRERENSDVLPPALSAAVAITRTFAIGVATVTLNDAFPARPVLLPERDGAQLATKIDGERFAVSLWLVAWLALGLDDRPDPLQIEVGDVPRRVPEVDAGHLAVTRIPDDRGNQCLRWIGRVAEAFVPALPLGSR